MRKNWQNRTVLITGESSGIGAASAEFLGARGMHILLSVRREDHLIKI